MEVPVRNIYHLLCYSWGKIKESKLVPVGRDEPPDILNLLASVLDGGLRWIRRRGLDRGYVAHTENLRLVRGRILFDETLRRGTLPNGIITCGFDEFSHDIPHNRILKATLRRLLICKVDQSVQKRLHEHLMLLGEISDIQLTNADFSRVVLHRNNQFYGFLLNICQFLHQNLLPLHDGKGFEFRDFLRDERAMGHIFEAFVCNYLNLQPGLSAKSEMLGWRMTGNDELSRELLPKMFTDVSVRTPKGMTVIECKFTSPTGAGKAGTSERLKSDHLYQLHAYLSSAQEHDSECEGLLLYPSVGNRLRLEFDNCGRRVRVATLDLTASWSQIEAELLDLVVGA